MRKNKNPEYSTPKFSNGWKKHVKGVNQTEIEALKLSIHGKNQIIEKQEKLIDNYMKQMEKYRENIREQEILILNCAKCKFNNKKILETVKKEFELKTEIPEIDNFIEKNSKINIKNADNELITYVESYGIALKWWWVLPNATRTLYVRMYCKDVDYASPEKVLQIYNLVNKKS